MRKGRRRVAIAVLVVVAGATLPARGQADSTMSRPAPIRDALDILLVGDSITLGRGAPPGFRDDLARLLADLLPPRLVRRTAFVGSSGETPFSGHFRGGVRATDLYPPTFGTGRGTGAFDVTTDLALGRAPCVVAIHIGTNDLSVAPPYFPYSTDHGETLAPTRSAELAELLSYIVARRAGDSPPIVLSLIIPGSGRAQHVADWNEAVVAMAEDFAEGVPAGRPVRIALADHEARFKANPDLFTFGPGDWMHDGLHPNAAGYAEMAAVYAATITAAVTDSIPPAAVTDLVAADIRMDRVAIALTASGDDARSGRAARYDLRLSASPITAETFSRALQVRGEPVPAMAGEPDTLHVRGLAPGREYFLALKVADDGGNRSPLSNGVVVTTAARGRTVVALRNGVDGYAGTSDVTLSNREPPARRSVGDRSASETLLIGATTHGDRPTDVNRAFLRFDLDCIPSAAQVRAAELRLHCYATGAAAPVRIIARRGPEEGGEPVASAELAAADTWCEWDVTAAVQAWVSGAWENDGLLLEAAADTVTNGSWFWAADYPDDAYLRPGLRIDYALGVDDAAREALESGR